MCQRIIDDCAWPAVQGVPHTPHTYTHARTRTHAHAYTHAHTRTCTHTHTHTHTQPPPPHTHTRTHTHKQALASMAGGHEASSWCTIESGAGIHSTEPEHAVKFSV